MKTKKLTKFEKELICENLDYSKEIDNEKVSIIYKGGKLIYKINDMKSSIFSQAQMNFLLNNFATKKEFNELKTKVEIVEKDVIILKEDVKLLKEDVEVLKHDVAILKKDVAILKEDVKILKQDVANLKEEVAKINVTLLGILDVLKDLRDNR